MYVAWSPSSPSYFAVDFGSGDDYDHVLIQHFADDVDAGDDGVPRNSHVVNRIVVMVRNGIVVA